MVNIPPISSSRLSIASGVMTPVILVTASFCAARILYAPFLVLLDILGDLGSFGVVVLRYRLVISARRLVDIC
jgi:hypothetical protein